MYDWHASAAPGPVSAHTLLRRDTRTGACRCLYDGWAGGPGNGRTFESQGVRALFEWIIDSLTTLFSQPVPAIAAGVFLGGALLVFSRSSFRAVTPEAPVQGLVLSSIGLVGRFLAVAIALVTFRQVAPGGLAYFGIAMAGTFLILYTVELVRFADLRRHVRPTPGPGTGGR